MAPSSPNQTKIAASPTMSGSIGAIPSDMSCGGRASQSASIIPSSGALELVTCESARFLATSCIPSFSRDAERLGEGSVLAQEFFVSLDERPQPFLGHVGDEIVDQAALPEQGMDAALGGAGSQLTIHAEAFAGGAQYRQQQDG